MSVVHFFDIAAFVTVIFPLSPLSRVSPVGWELSTGQRWYSAGGKVAVTPAPCITETSDDLKAYVHTRARRRH